MASASRVRETLVRRSTNAGWALAEPKRPTGRTSEVTGKPIKFLAFPVNAEVYGKTPKEVGFKLYFKPGGLFRQEGDHRADTDPKMFALARQTTHLPDPKLLPDTNALLERISLDLGDLIEQRQLLLHRK